MWCADVQMRIPLPACCLLPATSSCGPRWMPIVVVVFSAQPPSRRRNAADPSVSCDRDPAHPIHSHHGETAGQARHVPGQVARPGPQCVNPAATPLIDMPATPRPEQAIQHRPGTGGPIAIRGTGAVTWSSQSPSPPPLLVHGGLGGLGLGLGGLVGWWAGAPVEPTVHAPLRVWAERCSGAGIVAPALRVPVVARGHLADSTYAPSTNRCRTMARADPVQEMRYGNAVDKLPFSGPQLLASLPTRRYQQRRYQSLGQRAGTAGPTKKGRAAPAVVALLP